MTRSNFLSTSIAAVFLMALVATSGCKTSQKKDDATSGNDGAASIGQGANDNTMGDSDNGKAMGLETVHFAYDAFTLTDEGKETLKKNAQILKENKSVKIQIEGHCDSRGGIQYNIALGEKRANAVKKFLADLGIKGSRVTTISYGKERPVDSGQTEEAFAKNRRANFAITSK